MTIKELIQNLKRCPDENAEVRYKNMEIDDDCSIGQVIIKKNNYIVVGSQYKVILD